MEKVESTDGESVDIVSENIRRLKELFPDAFTEIGVNFDVLRQLLGDASVLDEGEEKYGLNWHGKKKARQIALAPSTGTLLPCPEESVDWDTTRNLFIEGDNLEVLKLLQKSYANKVKVIYIDPPYNTGKEFIYPDKYMDNLDTYLRYTRQIDQEGLKISSNTETSGRKHTNWLNMMYPRLKLARGLLASNGLIFISIDDNENKNLKMLCDEIFGEENFAATIIWQKIYSGKADAAHFAQFHEYILCYAKDLGSASINLLPRTDEMNARYKNPDNDFRGDWLSNDLTAAEERTNGHFDIVSPSGKIFDAPEGKHWLYAQSRMEEIQNDNRLWFGKNGDAFPRLKRFLSEVQQGRKAPTLWLHDEVGHTDEATKELKKLFPELPKIFQTPKPTRLISQILKLGYEKNSIVLDFFAGSSSTAAAVMNENASKDTSLRYIMVQIPEVIENGQYENIADFSLERIKRSISKTKEMNSDSNIDFGYKKFKLSSSNVGVWSPDRTNIEESLVVHEEHLTGGRTEQDVLYELLLKRGVDLAAPIECREIVGKNVYSIGYGVLFACLDESITKEQVEEISQGVITWYEELSPRSDTHVFFRDSAFLDDVCKTNMAAILEQNGITHVRSL